MTDNFWDNDMRRIKTAFMLLTCSAALTACGADVTDLPKKFEKNLAYTLGEYSVGDKKVLDENDIEWDIIFTDKNGKEQSVRLVSGAYNDFQKLYFDSKDEFEKYNLFDFYSDVMEHIADQELWDNIVSEYFDIEFQEKDFMKTDDIMLGFTTLSAVTGLTENSSDFIENKISPKNGIRLCEEDLNSIVSKDYMLTTFSIWVNDGVDPEPYVEKAKAVLADFQKYADDPKNYEFRVTSTGYKEVYFKKIVLFGEEIDESDLLDDEGNEISISSAIVNGLGAKKKE